jgi:hypothetical protein
MSPTPLAGRPRTAVSRKASPAILGAAHLVPRTLKTLLNEALNERVIVTENGRRRKISKFLAIIKQVINQAAKADWRHTKILLDIIRDIERQAEPAFPAPPPRPGRIHV